MEDIEGIIERYERSLRQREDDKFEEAREKFWVNIAAAIKKSKSCKSGANRDVKDTQREH